MNSLSCCTCKDYTHQFLGEEVRAQRSQNGERKNNVLDERHEPKIPRVHFPTNRQLEKMQHTKLTFVLGSYSLHKTKNRWHRPGA